MQQKFVYKTTAFFAFIILITLSGLAQKKITITSSKSNNYCNGTCTLFDNPELTGNPTAIIFITPEEVNRINLNPHPICAYYNGKQWSVMNVDNATIPPGAQFSVTYYTKPDEKHFVHVVTKENLVKNNSYVDHAGLNGNPNAQFQYFQNASPNVRGGSVNKSEIKFQYDEAAGKWYISNSNGSTLDFAAGYNISISSDKSSATNAITIANPGTTTINTTAFVPGRKTDNSGQRVFMTVVGITQGPFPGENMTTRIEITGFEMETNSPRDLASGLAVGKRQHLPILVEKATGTASLQCFKALTTNEQLSTVTFEVYNSSKVLDFKIVLTNAFVSYFKQFYADGQKGFVDSVKFTYQTIEFNKGGVSVSDTWPSIN